jgi:SAM-dependent methyltransferase
MNADNHHTSDGDREIDSEAAENDAARQPDTQASYDRVADEYVERIFDELRHKPLDRRLLERFAADVRDTGLVCDMGCGPGHVARYLHEQGVDVCGVDLSPAMVERARRLTPGIDFQQGDMLALDVLDKSWVGIAAFYSIIHVSRREVPRALAELKRVLRPGGRLLLAFHVGGQTIHLDEWWGQPVSVDFHFFRSEEMADFLRQAGFAIEEIIERDPYPEVEHPSRRSYLFARRPKRDG